MKIKITVKENRQMICSKYIIGTIGENNVTTLSFSFPEEIRDWQHYFVAEVKGESYVLPIENGTLLLPSVILTANCFKAQVLATNDNGEKWRSSPCRFMLFPRINDSAENVVEKAKSEQRETDRVELSEALTEITSEDLSGESWQGLLDKTKSLPLKTEQNVVDLTNYTALTYAFEHATTPPSLITGGYKLDKEEPDNPDSTDLLIKLPFLETPNAVYTSNTRVSANVEECGFSIGEASAKKICWNERSMFNSFGGAVAANLKRLTLVGIECVVDPRGMFNDSGSIEEITLIERGKNAEEYNTGYWYEFFRNCSNLQSILGTPLDMSRGTGYTRTFQKCSKLKCVRFKPFTISHDLDLSDCSGLMKGKYGANTDDPGTLLSIVNGVREYNSGMGQITIKLSAFVKDYLTSWRCVKDDETGLYIASTQGMTLATVLTNYKGVIIA